MCAESRHQNEVEPQFQNEVFVVQMMSALFASSVILQILPKLQLAVGSRVNSKDAKLIYPLLSF